MKQSVLIKSKRGWLRERPQGTVVEQDSRSLTREISRQLDPLQSDYGALRERAHSIQQSLRNAIALALEAPLEAHVQAVPHDTLSEKRALAKWLNAELRGLGLAIRCPKTDRPAYLIGSPCAPGDGSRFQLETQDDNGMPRRTCSSYDLPRLRLMVDTRGHGLHGPGTGRARGL